MTDFLWAAFELFITFFENLTVCHFICRFLKLDLKSRKGIILYLIGCVSFSVIVTVINNFTLYEGVYGLIYTVMFFAYSLFLPGSVIKKAFAAILANIVIVCTNALVTSTISAASGNAVAEILVTHTLERVIAVLSVQILLIYIFGIILKITADKDVALRSSEWLLILSVFVVSFVSITFIHMSQLYSDYNENQTRILLIAELGLVIINLICFYMTVAMSKSNRQATLLKLEKQQQEYRIKYAETIKNQYEETARLRHDMKQNFEVLTMLSDEKKYDEIGAFLKQCKNEISNIDVCIDVGNVFINAILNTKISIARNHDINFVFTGSKQLDGVADIDMCNLLGNILDNAIENFSASPDAHKSIICNFSGDEYKIMIYVSNTIEKSVLSENHSLKTSKSRLQGHGYGIKTIKQIAEKYNGSADFYEKDNMFVCCVMLYRDF